MLRGNLRGLREKFNNIFWDKNVSDCEEDDVLEIQNFELIDLDEIEEIQGWPFKREPFENTNFPIAPLLALKAILKSQCILYFLK